MAESEKGGGQVAASSTPELRCIDCGVSLQRKASGPKPLRCEPCKKAIQLVRARDHKRRNLMKELPLAVTWDDHMILGRTQTAEHKRKRAESTARTLASQRRVCIQCGKQYTPTLGAQRYCSGQCWNRMSRKKRAKMPRPKISPRERQFLLEKQGGGCAICGAPPYQPGSGRGRGKLAADHDWGTGRIRGLLCHDCNTGIGQFDHDITRLEKAIAYLKRT